MISAVDSTILFDIVGGDATFGLRSLEALRVATRTGRIVACDVVWAEFGGAYLSPDDAANALARFGLDYDAITADTALVAGAAWNRYRAAVGPRSRLIADFLVGAHALAQADRLLTRDRGFYRTYFSELQILDPSRP